MEFVYEITFLWKGKMKKISVTTEKVLPNKDEAENIAWGAIRGWFESEKISIPEYIRNVQFVGIKEFHWDVITLKSSSDNCK